MGNTSLKYFPIEVDLFDSEAVFIIEEKHGTEGGYIAVRLLLWLAAKNGWGLKWDETAPAFFAAKCLGDRNKAETAAEIASELTAAGIFDPETAEAGYLTSAEILGRWRAAMVASKKADYEEDLPEPVRNLYQKKFSAKRTETQERDPEKPQENSKNTPGTFQENSGNIPGNVQEHSKNTPGTFQENSPAYNIIYNNINNSSLERARARTREGTEDDPDPKPYTPEEREEALKKIDLWNELANGEDFSYSEIYPQEILVSRIIDRLRTDPNPKTWETVFKNAQEETRSGEFNWDLFSVFNKPNNFNRLKIHKRRKRATATAASGDIRLQPGFGERGYYS